MLKHLVVTAALLIGTAPATALTITLGEQDFPDGTIIPVLSSFNEASIGEPAPFDGFKGTDLSATVSFSASFTFSYAPGAYTAATLTFGIYDHDSAFEGDQVASFTVDEADLTAELNSIFEASGGQQVEVNVYTIDLSAVLAQLADGSATFSLTLQNGGLLIGNGAGLDFAQLNLREPDDVAVPEPGTLALLGAGISALALARRRRGPLHSIRH